MQAGKMERDELVNLCWLAQQWADSGDYRRGSNGWMTMFVDKLHELMTDKL